MVQSILLAPSGDVHDVQDNGKLSEPDDTGLDIGRQVSEESCKILSTKTTPVCHSSRKSGLQVKLARLYDEKCTWMTMGM